MENGQQFNKALILPIVSLSALLIKQLTGYQLDDHLQDAVCDAVMSMIVLIGIFTHPKKKINSYLSPAF